MSERRHVAAEVADRLRHRGIALTGSERPHELADLLSAAYMVRIDEAPLALRRPPRHPG